MKVDAAKLREMAEAATPGPWHSRHGITTADVWPDDPTKHPGICNANMSADDDATDQEHRNAAFIAAANPQTVIALLDENERLRRDRDSYANSDFERQLDDARSQLAAANAEIERLRRSDAWNAAHAKMMARAADNEKADREVFRLALGDCKQQLAAMTKARDEACDALTSSRSFTPHELAGIANALRKVGQ